MKLPFKICDSRFTTGSKSGRAVSPLTAGAHGVTRPVTCAGNRKSQEGIALVITLILLSVTLFMAIAFLAISRRERGSVTTATDTATARLAADSALANAQAQIIANIFATTNPYSSSLLVSTNFINVNGFTNGVANVTNVNYFDASGNLLSGVNFEQNVANLFLSPRPPVFVTTNRQTGATDFRFYLDLNRNGSFENTGLMPQTNNAGKEILDASLNPIIANNVGDPQWVGVLERPDVPHGPNNKFLSRYAYVCLPAGDSLDLNAIHNQAETRTVNPNPTSNVSDGFIRNQGVGSWEINLAAFLADLNTNEWGQIVGSGPGAPVGAATYYLYNQPAGANSGHAFEDALSLLSYRYGFNYSSLSFVSALFPNGALGLGNEPIDIYPFGLPLMTNTVVPFYLNPPNNSWAGADNTNRFFNLSADLFDPSKSSGGATGGFTNRLLNAGTNADTYDRYTFYRLLSQLGTDSTPESGKMNLNYDNLDFNGNVVPGLETNLTPWTPIRFFTFAADRMLRLYTTNWYAADFNNFTNTFGTNAIPFGVTNIPVWVGGRLVYSSAVNRLLQLAANMYDATTNNNPANLTAAGLPSVFQPIFSVQNNNVYIANFVEVTNTTLLANPLLNLNFGTSVLNTLNSNRSDLVFGVPLIIGAKKGFPNFNEFAMQSGFQLTRKLQVTRSSTNATVAPISSYKVNQMFNLSVTNQLGVECWNSYAGNYSRPVNIFVTNYLTMVLTNDEGFNTNAAMILSGFIPIPNSTNSVWPGYNPNSPSFSFQIPLNTNVAFVPVSMYRFNGGSPFLTTNVALPYETNVLINGSAYPQPTWGLAVTNNVQVVMVDVTSGRIIDYVQLSGPNSSRNLSAEIQSEYDKPNFQGYNGLWMTNLSNQGIPNGIVYQIGVSLGNYGFSGDFLDTTLHENEIDGFRAFYHQGLTYTGNPGESSAVGIANSTNAMQAPYTPTANTYQHTTWQANDPLVHYLASDLAVPANNALDANYNWPGNIGLLNARYFPWGGNPLLPSADTNRFNMAVKDPQAIISGSATSDNWDFPTNKFPAVGWLGRVHRGTPWQTVYLKASGVNANDWAIWTGDLNLFDATNMVPGRDRLLFDIFTTALNDNATRGQLSVNQTHLAAWSALFSGLIVPPISLTNSYQMISPAGPAGISVPAGRPAANSPFAMGYLVQNGTNGIDDIRANTNLFPQQVFKHVGDILATPALTEQSPFLNLANTSYNNDELYEWLPQQTMGLLTVSATPRYVIYSYGQTLKPAPNGITTDGNFFGMVTNYQVVSEIATRAVVRVNTVLATNASGTLTTNYSTTVEQFNVLPPD
jgi:hypothetical protein